MNMRFSKFFLIILLLWGCKDGGDKSPIGKSPSGPPPVSTHQTPPSNPPDLPNPDANRVKEKLRQELLIFLPKIEETLKELEGRGVFWGKDWTPLPLRLMDHKLNLRNRRKDFDLPGTSRLFTLLRDNLEIFSNRYRGILPTEDEDSYLLLLKRLQEKAGRTILEESQTLYEYCMTPDEFNSPAILETLQALREAIYQPYATCDQLEAETQKDMLLLHRVNGHLDLRPLISLSRSPLKHLEIVIFGLDYKTDRPLDLSPLRHLTQLEFLGIQGLQIKDVSPLIHLKNLKVLDLAKSNLENIVFLNELPRLQTLILRKNKVQSLSPLITLKDLQVLDLSENLLKNIEGIENLKNLKQLALDRNQIEDVSKLTVLINLNLLNFDFNPIIPNKDHCPTEGPVLLLVKKCQSYLSSR